MYSKFDYPWVPIVTCFFNIIDLTQGIRFPWYLRICFDWKTPSVTISLNISLPEHGTQVAIESLNTWSQFSQTYFTTYNCTTKTDHFNIVDNYISMHNGLAFWNSLSKNRLEQFETWYRSSPRCTGRRTPSSPSASRRPSVLWLRQPRS